MNFVLSTNNNPTYVEFLKPICNYYKELGHNVYICYIGENFLSDINADHILQIKPILNYDVGIQAKLCRSYLITTLDDNKVYTLMDIDQILIDIKWLKNIIKTHEWKLLNNKNDILAIGANGYLNTEHSGKWPIAFTSGTSSGFKKLFNLKDNCSFYEFIEKFSKIQNPIDGKENTKNKFNSFSDESLFRYCSIENNISIINENIPNFINLRSSRRIDRESVVMVRAKNKHYGLDFWNQSFLTENQKKMIMDGFFMDCCPSRPYSKYKSLIDDIIKVSLKYNKNNHEN